MSYTKQTGIPCGSAETVVKLDDTGALVAVQCPCERDPQTNVLVFTAQARAIGADGTQQQDALGRAIITSLRHASNADELAALTADVIARECLYLVLGEPLTANPNITGATLVPFSAANVAQQSIRNAIAAATTAVPAASSVL